MGLLSTMLSGAAYGTELGDRVHGPRAGHDGHFVLALDVAAFESRDRFGARVDDVVRQIRDGRRAAGVERIYPPGHLEFETEARHRREGIPLNAGTVDGLRSEAVRQGLDPTTLDG
jgi:LDH2 family malate/lactate/ureidoglycolate dehydrogenase